MATTPAPSFNDLLTIPSQDDVLNQEVIPEVQKRAVRVTDWIVGGVYRAMAYVVALLKVNVRVAIAAIMAFGFEDYVFGFATPPPDQNGNVIDVTGYCGILAQQRYGVVRIPASYTKRTITLTNSTASTYVVQPGNMIIQFPSGNRYMIDAPEGAATGPVTIASNATTKATFRSEFTSDTVNGLSYNDPSNSAIVLVTSSFAGVTATNPSTTFSPVGQAGSGLGTVTPSGAPGSPHAVSVRIVVSGNVTGSTVGWQYSLDGGAWSATQTGASASVGGSITVTLADNGGNPAFVLGTVYYFTAPGSDITQIGADIETPQALGTRVRGLWPSLAFPQDGSGNWIPTSPTQPAYVALALSANGQVRIAFVANGAVNNELKIVIAGQGGAPLSSLVVASEQSFFNAFQMLTDLPVISTSTARAVTLAGLTLTCKSGQLAAAQASLTQQLQLYLGGVDARAPLSINGLVDYDYIIALARTTSGVTHISGTLTINGAAADLQLPVTPGAYESATWSQSAATAFSWATT